jgi:hypothetical protein
VTAFACRFAAGLVVGVRRARDDVVAADFRARPAVDLVGVLAMTFSSFSN